MASLNYWLWLTTRRGLGSAGLLRVLEHFLTPERAYYADPEEYVLIEGLSRAARASLEDKSLDSARRILEECQRQDIRVMTLGDGDYPERLRQISDPPVVLYLQGRSIPFDQEAAIAVVGARGCTPYGARTAGQMGLELARGGALLVSGCAAGIDRAALEGALRGGGRVVSLMAGGVDVRRPLENRGLLADVAARGVLISEYPPGTPPLGDHYHSRNRIISGLSLGVVAVEAKRRSGTMLTVGHALDQNRDIFAVPGNVDAPMSEGTNYLIRQGARLVTCARDVLEEYWDRFPDKLAPSAPLTPEAAMERLSDTLEAARMESRREAAQVPMTSEPQQEAAQPPPPSGPQKELIPLEEQKDRFTDDELELLRALAEGTGCADELVDRTQIPARRVLSALTMLQVEGAVEELPGRRFSSLVELERQD